MDCYCNEIVQSLQTKKLRSISYLGAFHLLGEFKKTAEIKISAFPFLFLLFEYQIYQE